MLSKLIHGISLQFKSRSMLDASETTFFRARERIGAHCNELVVRPSRHDPIMDRVIAPATTDQRFQEVTHQNRLVSPANLEEPHHQQAWSPTVLSGLTICRRADRELDARKRDEHRANLPRTKSIWAGLTPRRVNVDIRCHSAKPCALRLCKNRQCKRAPQTV